MVLIVKTEISAVPVYNPRIKQKRLEFKYSLRSLAKALKITHSTIHHWETGLAEPTGKNLIILAEAFETSPEWLTSGSVNKNIHRSGYELTKIVSYYNSQNEVGFIPKSIIKERLLYNIKLHKMDGDSMSPLINDSSIVAIDTTQTKITDGQIYLFKHGNIDRIKNLALGPNEIKIISFNKNYNDELVESKDIQIKGQIIWISNII